MSTTQSPPRQQRKTTDVSAVQLLEQLLKNQKRHEKHLRSISHNTLIIALLMLLPGLFLLVSTLAALML
jgi:hypothetical protein